MKTECKKTRTQMKMTRIQSSEEVHMHWGDEINKTDVLTLGLIASYRT